MAKAYKHLSGHRDIRQSFNWIWKCSCQNKHKVFAWLILMDRLSTREILKRKNMVLEDYPCVLCSTSTEESLFHLLIACPFASHCWSWIGLQISQQMSLFQNLESLKDQLHESFFIEIIILMCWLIWQSRNGVIFNSDKPSPLHTKRTFKLEFALLILHAKRSYFPRIESWISNLA